MAQPPEQDTAGFYGCWLSASESRLCKEPDCEEPVLARGWCRKHYDKWRRQATRHSSSQHNPTTCKEPGCERPHQARGWCSMHYKRWRRHGDPTIPRRRRQTADRFWSHVDKNGPTHPQLGSRCWLWTACKRGGFGLFALKKGRDMSAHRFSYELATGKSLGNGLKRGGVHIDQLCLNKLCVNPDHLREVALGHSQRRAWKITGAERDSLMRQMHVVRRMMADLTEAEQRDTPIDQLLSRWTAEFDAGWADDREAEFDAWCQRRSHEHVESGVDGDGDVGAPSRN